MTALFDNLNVLLRYELVGKLSEEEVLKLRRIVDEMKTLIAHVSVSWRYEAWFDRQNKPANELESLEYHIMYFNEVHLYLDHGSHHNRLTPAKLWHTINDLFTAVMERMPVEDDYEDYNRDDKGFYPDPAVDIAS